MKATKFEYRHQTLLHLAAVSVAFLTYLVNRDDIVWVLVRGQSNARLFERIAFALATLLIGVATALRTWGRTQAWSSGSGSLSSLWTKDPIRYLHYPLHVGNFLFAIGLGFLAPLPGFIFLLIAEAVLGFRLIVCEKSADNASFSEPSLGGGTSVVWRNAVRPESGKWGVFFTMVVFTLLLNDRVAEVLGAGSFLLAIVLNYKSCYSAISSES